DKKGHKELAKRYFKYWQKMVKNFVPIFFNPQEGKIRGVARIRDVHSKTIAPSNYADGGYFLDNSYEGRIAVLDAILYGVWQNANDKKRVMDSLLLVKATFVAKDGRRFTIERGHWGSSHEAWWAIAGCDLDHPVVRRVFINTQKARTWFSADHGYPGNFASTHIPVAGNQDPEYEGALGFPPAREKIARYDIFAPYAAFPIILANRKVGWEWFHAMTPPQIFGKYGLFDSISADGTKVANLYTWDGIVTTLEAMDGGSADEHRESLKEDGKYDEYMSLEGGWYEGVFGKGKLEGEDQDFALPTARIPTVLLGGQKSDSSGIADVLNGSAFKGEGKLFKDGFTFENGVLSLSPLNGYIWNRPDRTDLKVNHFVNFRVNTRGGENNGFNVELKNTEDNLITPFRLRIEPPDTSNSFQVYSADVTSLLKSQNTMLGVFAISDPNTDVQFKREEGAKGISFTNVLPKGAKLLKFDGRRFSLSDDSEKDKSAVTKPVWKNLLAELNLYPDPDRNIVMDRDGSAVMFDSSGGWAWGKIEKTDIRKNPDLHLIYSSNGGSRIWLELKNSEDEHVVGRRERFGIPKVLLDLPDTGGKLKEIVIPLADEILQGVDTHATIIAFSDPQGGRLRLEALGLTPVSKQSLTGMILSQVSPKRLATMVASLAVSVAGLITPVASAETLARNAVANEKVYSSLTRPNQETVKQNVEYAVDAKLIPTLSHGTWNRYFGSLVSPAGSVLNPAGQMVPLVSLNAGLLPSIDFGDTLSGVSARALVQDRVDNYR
ncbi:MAG: hypothetical protein HYY07_04230, partial [Elusimicrobia bacterium]|nr:hypothetical protein [Elusimicrobiota bacterium]